MAHILLFHHALGQSAGFREFADQLRGAGHTVTAPDLFEGRVFEDVHEGVAFAKQVGFDQIDARAQAAAEALPADLVYAGFSLGAMPAQRLTQTRAGAAGALLYHSAVPTAEFGKSWPQGVPLQLHIMENDPWDDLPFCQQLAQEVDRAELFIYPGSGHLFADSSSADYEPEAARLLLERTLSFLDRVG